MNERTDERTDDRADRKQPKPQKVQYMVWWRAPGGPRREYGPIYSKKAAVRDGFFYQDKYGAGNGGWELYDPNPRRGRDDRGGRRRY